MRILLLIGAFATSTALSAQDPAQPGLPLLPGPRGFSVFRLPGWVADLPEPADGRFHRGQRLVHLLRGGMPAAADAAPPRISLASHSMQISGRCTAEQQATIVGALSLLAASIDHRVRLHCALLTLPLEQAMALGLQPGVTQRADDAGTALARAATSSGGSGRNLPELVIERLQPFLSEPKVTPATRDTVLRLRGEMLPLSPTEVVVDLELVRGDLPQGKPQAPMAAVLRTVVRLAAGQTAITMVADGDAHAIVLVVRCVEIAASPPAPDKR